MFRAGRKSAQELLCDSGVKLCFSGADDGGIEVRAVRREREAGGQFAKQSVCFGASVVGRHHAEKSALVHEVDDAKVGEEWDRRPG
jgi:hypothetical protein